MPKTKKEVKKTKEEVKKVEEQPKKQPKVSKLKPKDYTGMYIGGKQIVSSKPIFENEGEENEVIASYLLTDIHGAAFKLKPEEVLTYVDKKKQK